MFRYTPALASLTVLALFSGTAAASGLQVTPVTLTLQQNQRAEGLWLSNSGDSPVNAQVRVFHWSQSGYSDQLSSSQGLVISPPMLNIPPGGKQLIRVIRTGPPTKVEDAYRLSINELPPSTTTTTKKKQPAVCYALFRSGVYPAAGGNRNARQTAMAGGAQRRPGLATGQ